MRETRQGGLVLAVQVLVSTLALALLTGACGPSATATPTPAAATPTPTRAAPAATPTPTPTSSAAPRPTDTPARTPTPTAAAATMATATPTPATSRLTPVPQVKTGGVAVFAHRGDPIRGWDLQSTFTNQYVIQPIGAMGNLVRVCRPEPFTQCPGLAEKWEVNSDFTQWTFKVRDGLVWHDGKPFDAQSAKESLELIVFGYKGRPPHQTAPNWGPISTVEALDGNRVRVTLKRGVPGFLQLLARSEQYFAFAPHVFKPAIDAGKSDVTVIELGVIGLGPFRLKGYDKGSEIRIERFDRYWEKDAQGKQLPYLDGITFPIIADTDAVTAAIRSGRLDGGSRGNDYGKNAEILRQQFGDGVYFIPDNAGTEGLAFNAIDEGPFKDERVRRAVGMAYDRAGFQKVFFPSYPPRPLFIAGSPFANPDFMTWPGYNQATRQQDIAAAKQLLAQAGYANGFQTKILTRASAEWDSFAEYGAQQMALLGIQAQVEIVDDATLTDRGCKGTFSVRMTGGPNLTQEVPWAGNTEFGTINSNQCANIRHNDQNVDDLFQKMSLLSDVAQQGAIAQELERIILRDKVYYIINNSAREYPYRSYVKNMIPAINSRVHYMDNAWVWMDK